SCGFSLTRKGRNFKERKLRYQLGQPKGRAVSYCRLPTLPTAYCLLFFRSSSRPTGGTTRSSAAFSSASESFRKLPEPVSTLARYFSLSFERCEDRTRCGNGNKETAPSPAPGGGAACREPRSGT